MTPAEPAPTDTAHQVDNQKTVSVFETAVFKLHNPSRHKRAMLMDAMKRAHLAYGKLLERNLPSQAEVQRLLSMTKRDRRAELFRLKSALEREASRWPQLSGGAKAAISRDAMAQISSFIELHGVQEEVGRPTVTAINATRPEYEAAVDEFRRVITVEEEGRLRDAIARVARMGAIRPLGFYKVRRSDGFLLLKHPETQRHYCWLNLHPRNSRFASPVAVRDLVNLQTGEIISFTSQTGALFGLEMGHAFHELEFIKRGRPQSARLVWRRERHGKLCDDFELHVAFKWTTPRIETRLWLGVDRGIYNLAAYAVVDDDGRVVEEGAISGRHLRFVQRRHEQRAAKAQRRGRTPRGGKRHEWATEAVHVTANELVRLAGEHRAQIVLEDLSALSAIGKKKRVLGRRRGGFNRLLGRKQYEKLKSVLTYKLREHGLPDAVSVRAAGTSQTCPECSHWSGDNRKKVSTGDEFEMSEFKCVKCGYEADADVNAARVIAMKGRWLTSLPRKSKRSGDGRLPDELKFGRFLVDRAQRRGEAPAS